MSRAGAKPPRGPFTTVALGAVLAVALAAAAVAVASFSADDYPAGNDPWGMALSDLDRDGDTDLVVTNFSTPNGVQVLLGEPNGSFGDAVPYSTEGGSTRSVGVADFNGDGNRDLVVANQNPGENIAVLRGKPNGTFRAAHTFAEEGDQPVSLTVDDFNRDGKRDVAVVDPDPDMLSIMRGKGDGTLRAPTHFELAGLDPTAVTVGDFNRDGKQDLAVACYTGTGVVETFEGKGDGTFKQSVDYPLAGTAPTNVAVGEFNGDGRQDLAITDSDNDRVATLEGKANGTFKDEIFHDTGLIPWGMTVANVEGDSAQDLVVANSADDDVSVLEGVGDGTFEDAVDYEAGDKPFGVASGRFDGDNKRDLAVSNRDGDSATILLND